MWFDPASVAHGANAASFAKGLQLLRSQAVLDWFIEPPPPTTPLPGA